MAQDNELQAVDLSLQLSMNTRKGGDNALKIETGVSGRRIPLSFLVGVHYMEFDNDGGKLGLNGKYGAWGANATEMVRLFSIRERSINMNAYCSQYWNKDLLPLLEYGGKIGILINTRSMIYANAGVMQNNKYHSFTAGVTFSMLFFNGYSAY